MDKLSAFTIAILLSLSFFCLFHNNVISAAAILGLAVFELTYTELKKRERS